MLGLLAFSAFSIDHGVLMVSRGQAQNAADAGALAAGLYLTWDDATDQPGAQAMGVAAAQQNSVWGATPDITTTDVTFPTCPPGSPGPVDLCVKVDVFRNQRPGGNPLPAFFSSLVGVPNQGVRATATAQVLYGNATDCVLPFAIPDRWLEVREDEAGTAPDEDPANHPFDENEGMSNLPDGYWDPNDTYDAYETQGQQGGNPLPGTPGVDVDLYTPGPPRGGGTGYQSYRDHGIEMALKMSNGSQIAPGWYYPIVLPDGNGNGAAATMQRITHCSDVEIPEDMRFTVEPGNMVGPIRLAVQALIDQDPSASWSYTQNLDGTWGNVTGSAFPHSPRVRAVPVFDVDNYMSGQRTGRGDIVVTGFIGVFLDRIQNGDVMGYTTSLSFAANSGNLTNDPSSFLRTVILVR